MNCPDCGTLAYPRARKCHGCGTPLAWSAAIRDRNEQPAMHPLIAQRLSQLGFYKYPDETAEQFSKRCRHYMLERYVHHVRRHEHAA